MRVKLKISSGLGRYGSEVEIPDEALAKTLIASHKAEPVGKTPPPPPAPPKEG